MPTITVQITGATHGAVLRWDAQHIPLTTTSPGNFAAVFNTAVGPHIYNITVFGAPTDPWSASVTNGTTSQNHQGHMSPGGADGTGDTGFMA